MTAALGQGSHDAGTIDPPPHRPPPFWLALARPASEKRQGTKSRWVGHPAGQRALWGFVRVVRADLGWGCGPVWRDDASGGAAAQRIGRAFKVDSAIF
jgi:hypothetical protein